MFTRFCCFSLWYHCHWTLDLLKHWFYLMRMIPRVIFFLKKEYSIIAKIRREIWDCDCFAWWKHRSAQLLTWFQSSAGGFEERYGKYVMQDEINLSWNQLLTKQSVNLFICLQISYDTWQSAVGILTTCMNILYNLKHRSIICHL